MINITSYTRVNLRVNTCSVYVEDISSSGFITCRTSISILRAAILRNIHWIKVGMLFIHPSKCGGALSEPRNDYRKQLWLCFYEKTITKKDSVKDLLCWERWLDVILLYRLILPIVGIWLEVQRDGILQYADSTSGNVEKRQENDSTVLLWKHS